MSALKRGDRLGLLLSCVRSLKSLSLSYDDETEYAGADIQGDVLWLKDVLQCQHWTSLTHFTLQKFNVRGPTLEELFNQHGSTLKCVVLHDVLMPDMDWLIVLKNMRDELTLTRALISLRKNGHGNDIQKIITDHGSSPLAADSLVDIGTYVVPSAIRVTELD